jgi:hypothetical protein
MNSSRSPSPEEENSRLTEREQKIARRVRQSLHLSASMSVDEVARQFRGSVAWRRERLGLAGEELRERLSRAGRGLLRALRDWTGTD